MHADRSLRTGGPGDAPGEKQRTGRGAESAVGDLGRDAAFAHDLCHRHGVVERAARRIQRNRLHIFAARLDLGFET
jgi:hypothetical protein